ncbi:DUF2130 domain-containing protein, partial [Patescibacteria group bacterium]|nr:DUF2130 domain-containing protein [Patescibacteria group bacterium]
MIIFNKIMVTVTCRNCGKDVDVSLALKHQVSEEIKKELSGKHKEELEKLRLEIEKKAGDKIREELEFKMKNFQNENAEEKEKSKKLNEQLLEMNKSIRDLRTKDEQRELEMEKKLNAQREKLQEEISKTIKEKSDLEKAELQKQLNDTKKALEEAQRKAAQKSQQLQGEVLELDLEAQLKDAFPTDEITPVPKGIEGADISQKVRNKFGQNAGIILWETKRAKAWGRDWSMKLREEKRKFETCIAILVSDVLPESIEKFGYYENIWVTSYEYALPLAEVLRIELFELAVAKSTSVHKDEKLEALFVYLTKDSFRNRFETQVESIISLKNDLETEQRSTVRLWKKREMQIKRL